MVLKVHNVDGSTKMVAIHDGMNARDVCFLLAERNHKELGPNWTLVERLPDLHLGKALARRTCGGVAYVPYGFRVLVRTT